ncbi:hypothetical protein SAMN05216266_101522 [Amycolatopsis marina]|uniref:Uncharacterized protein n=1 Tax=Amycolatopsis marina TaxID=490629 RepID=A0A1I0VX53_9PSEU|nr:hypothetical protein [Amycolatopsis marina]SFA80246.1 hypothetical protein SAMN05216266_101522 [Amycolatopsis marina]
MIEGARSVYRDEDGELLGYLRPAGEGWQPLTVFGYPLADPADEADSRAELEARGLACLADRWSVYLPEDEDWFACQIRETGPDWVRVSIADFGSPDFGAMLTLHSPGPDRLRLG